MESVACKNCGADVEANFCSNCGQKKQSRISIKQIGEDIYNGFFDFESPFLKTIVCLTVNPGKVYREYLDGARKRYFSPVRYSMWVMALMVAIAGFTDTKLIDFSQFEYLASMGVDKGENLQQEFSIFVENFQSILNALLIPMYFLSSILLAVFLRLFFIKQKLTIAELFLPALLSQCHFTLFTSLTLLAGIYYNIWTLAASFILSLVYMCWGLAQIYTPTRMNYYVRSMTAGLVSYICFSALFPVMGYLVGYYYGLANHVS